MPSCDLFIIVIEKPSLTGNCNLLKLKGRSAGIMGIRGMNTVSPAPLRVKLDASMTLLSIFLRTGTLVPLQRLGGSKL